MCIVICHQDEVMQFCIEIYVYSDEQPLRLKLLFTCIKTDASPLSYSQSQ